MQDLEKRTAQAIVNIFETGRLLGDYGAVTLLAGDTGQLTYGRSQTTLASGNLFLLIKDYCEAAGSQFGAAMQPYLPRLSVRDAALNHDFAFRGLLREAGDDPVMRGCQDQFFDRVYWVPATRSADTLGIAAPLGVATVYDSTVHGSWTLMRDRTIAQHGRPPQVPEQDWVRRYVAVRRAWLAGHSNTLLQKTVYRMDALQRLIDDGKWALPLPLTVRGVAITADALLAVAPLRVSAQVAEERLLRLQTPFQQGEDVRRLQQALAKAGFAVDADGVFGPNTETALKAAQAKLGLKADGIAGAATRAALGL